MDAEPPAGIGIVADDAKHLLGELAPAVVVADVEAVAASVLFQSRVLALPAGLIAPPPTGALRSVGADGHDIIALEAAVGWGREYVRRRRSSGNSFAEGREGNRGSSDGEEKSSLCAGHDIYLSANSIRTVEGTQSKRPTDNKKGSIILIFGPACVDLSATAAEVHYNT